MQVFVSQVDAWNFAYEGTKEILLIDSGRERERERESECVLERERKKRHNLHSHTLKSIEKFMNSKDLCFDYRYIWNKRAACVVLDYLNQVYKGWYNEKATLWL